MPPRKFKGSDGGDGGGGGGDDLPDIDRALTELTRRAARAYGAALVRLCGVAVLDALLLRSTPGARGLQPVLDAVGAVLILWPLFTALGRLYAWRIALGRAYARAARWPAAERTLAPFLNPRVRMLYDAGGEGLYWLASAYRTLGRSVDSERLFAVVAREARGAWSDAARAELAPGALEAASAARYPLDVASSRAVGDGKGQE